MYLWISDSIEPFSALSRKPRFATTRTSPLPRLMLPCTPLRSNSSELPFQPHSTWNFSLILAATRSTAALASFMDLSWLRRMSMLGMAESVLGMGSILRAPGSGCHLPTLLGIGYDAERVGPGPRGRRCAY